MGNTSEKALFLTKTWVERSINKGKTILALFVLEKGEGEIPLHPLAQPPFIRLMMYSLMICLRDYLWGGIEH